MFEASFISLLTADTELVGLLSSFSGEPAVFNWTAPQKAEYPYVVFDTSRRSEIGNLAIAPFDINIDIYARSESGVAIRQIAERIEFITDRTQIKNDSRFNTIRLYFESGEEVENDDIDVRHYVIRISARGGRQKWADQIQR